MDTSKPEYFLQGYNVLRLWKQGVWRAVDADVVDGIINVTYCHVANIDWRGQITKLEGDGVEITEIGMKFIANSQPCYIDVCGRSLSN